MNLDMFKSRDEEDKRVLYPVEDCYNVVDVNLKFPIGFWVIGILLILLLFIIAFCFVGFMNPIEHTAQIVVR